MKRVVLAAILLAGCSNDCKEEREAVLTLVDEHLACDVDADCLVSYNHCVERRGDGYFAIGASMPSEEFEAAIAELNQCGHATDFNCTGGNLAAPNLRGACIDGICAIRQVDRAVGGPGDGGGGGSAGAPGEVGLELRVLEEQSCSGGDASSDTIDPHLRVVVDDSEEWGDVWSAVTGSSSGDLPVVNFDQEVVLGARMGWQSDCGNSISVASAIPYGDDVVVTLELRRAGEGCMADQALSNPYTFVAIERPLGEVRFVEREVHDEDCTYEP